MTAIHRFPKRRLWLVLAASGLLVGACSKDSAVGGFIHHADQLVTAYEPSRTSPYNRRATANCPEWREFMSRRDIDEDKWWFGCANTASLVVSVSKTRDLLGGRRLRPSDAWEAVKTDTDDRAGKLDPGQSSTTAKSTTTSTN